MMFIGKYMNSNQPLSECGVNIVMAFLNKIFALKLNVSFLEIFDMFGG